MDARLDEAADGQVVLLSAPAGYGKTLLLADWVARHPGRTAWLTIDTDDNDDRRFWAAVLAALATCPAVPADNAVHTVALPDVPSRDAAFLPALIDALDAVPGPITLVLDDVHELTHVDPLHGLASLVRDRPSHLRLVLSTRLDPPIRLSRLRLSGGLLELRAPELALTVAETEAVFEVSEVDLSPAQLEVLHELTEGWPAGLRLAALSLRDTDDIDLFLTDLVGNDMAISDYLVGEILSRLPAAVVEVLSSLSVCDQLTASLAGVVSGNDEAGDVLAALERETSLVVSYGTRRQWFRIHPLLRAQLRADLQRRRPDLVAALHERAARWFAAANAPSTALRHARLTGEPWIVADLLREHGVVLATSGHHTMVCSALEALDQQRGDTRLLLIGVLAHLECGQLDTADTLLSQVEETWPAHPTAELESLRTIARARRSWYGATWPDPGMIDAGGGDAANVPGLDVVEMLLRADTAMAGGKLLEAERLARSAVDRAGREGNAYLAARSTVTLGVLAGLRCDIPRMVALAEQADRMAPAGIWRNTVGAAFALLLRSYGALLQGNPQECLRQVATVAGVTDAMPTPSRAEISTILPVLGVVRAAARFDLGEHRAGLDAMRAARSEVPQARAMDPTVAFVALLEHGAALHLGLPVHARTVLEWAQVRLGRNGDVLFMRAAAAAADRGATRSRHDGEARALMRPLIDGLVVPAVPWTMIGGRILECALALRADNRPQARHAVATALTASAEMGVLRPLVGAPPEVADLITQQLGSLGETEPLAREVLAIRRARSAGEHGGPGGRTGTGLADRPRAGGARTASVVALARGDRRRAVRHRQHGQDPRRGDLREARRPLPARGGRRRAPFGADRCRASPLSPFPIIIVPSWGGPARSR